MSRSYIAVDVGFLEDDLLKICDLATILNSHMIETGGLSEEMANALSHLTIDIKQAAERIRGHVSNAYDLARSTRGEP